ncbi:MAG: HEAT repeat domain-containing protein [Gemmataceae bacterium]
MAISLGAEADAEADEQTLRAARLPADGPTLLTVFRKRTPDADSQARIKALIARLGSDSFSERQTASEQLAERGVEAAGLLRKATRHADLEIRWRARDALAVIEQNELSADALIAALHVLARLKPPRLAVTLLNYLPHAADADVVETVSATLAAAALRDGNADPELVRAVAAESPIQRGVAGAALCLGGCRKQFPAVRRLLRDADPQVRCRVGLALLEARDKAAVPVLIELLGVLPIGEGERIESMLLQIAGDSSPKGQLDEKETRAKYRDAWSAWWKSHGDGLDLAKVELAPSWRGYILAVCFGIGRARGRSGTVVEFDAHGRTRWQLRGLIYPVDAQVLDERRVLVTEYSACQVTERNLNGDILRRINVPDSPLEARRLSNGNTLITTSNRVFEMDREDKVVWNTDGNGRGTIVAACPLPGGQVGICHASGGFVRLDRQGKPVSSFRVGRLFRPIATHIQGLPNGHVLVPLYYDNKVVEYDEKGTEVWSASYARPTSAQRLPNGRTLVAGYAGNVIVELDKDGREVKRQQCDGRLMSVRGR